MRRITSLVVVVALVSLTATTQSWSGAEAGPFGCNFFDPLCGTPLPGLDPTPTPSPTPTPTLTPDEGDANPSLEEAPNILLIYTDDQHYETIEFMPILQERLVDAGVTFTNAYATTPLCCPSRATLFTGQYAGTHGVLTNNAPNGGFALFQDAETLPVWLTEAGYRTGLFGKYLNEYDQPDATYIPPGWDRWFAVLSPGGSYRAPEVSAEGTYKKFRWANYSTDLTRKMAVNYIKANVAGDAPLFIMYAPGAPHLPVVLPARHKGTCDDLAVEHSPAFNESDVSDKPRWVRNLEPVDVEQSDTIQRGKICLMKAVDEAIAFLLEAFGDELANTFVIFTSDNGWSPGEHRWQDKRCIYEGCARVPLVITGPSFAPGTTDDRLFPSIDLAPTILALAGIEIPASVEGRSYFDEPVSEFMLEIFGHRAQKMIVTDDGYKYGEFVRRDECELYDMSVDPFELQNVCGNSGYAAIQADLSARLSALQGD